jgi:hypothetical protein
MNLNGKVCSVLFWITFLLSAAAQAGGPLNVTGVNASNPGQPYVWADKTITYKTDQGKLGNQTNAQANLLVSSAFAPWQSTNLIFESSGSLDQDITSNNFDSFYQSAQANCTDPSQFGILVAYDVDGSIINDFFGDNNSILGVSLFTCVDHSTGHYQRSISILNGRFIDGQPDTPSHSTISLTGFQSVMTHEFGHSIGMDHSQVNLNCLIDATCTSNDLAGLPIMFPVMLTESKTALTVDDRAALSMLYPDPTDTTMGRIQGRVYFSDSQTPAQGYNVIARKVSDPRRTAISSVSGFLYTSDRGNPYYPYDPDDPDRPLPSPLGSHDQNLLGFYDIPGLPPGDYTIDVEAINDTADFPFVDSSSVGPIGANEGFQYSMPGSCSLQHLNYPSSPSDSCTSSTSKTVGAGAVVNTNTDIILLGTAPQFDAWEDNQD